MRGKELIYGMGYDQTVRHSVRASRSIADTLDTDPIGPILKAITEAGENSLRWSGDLTHRSHRGPRSRASKSTG